MENPRLKSDIPNWERILIHPANTSVILAAFCLGLHHNALSGGWRYDDGQHLYFAALYSPWQYFFVPEIMREQSWANFTPWNALFYEIGLPFFGLNPSGYYAHLLLVIWLTAVTTSYLLRVWLTPLAAFMGASLFLAMPATGAIAQMLMTGHYAYGLLFSVLTFYFLTRGIREKKILFSLLSAACYAMACWSKEVYVPIIALLWLLPACDLRTRMWHLWPATFVAFIYTVYRSVVLEGIGGYGIPLEPNALVTADTWISFFSNLIGDEWMWQLIVAYIGISLMIAIITQKQQINVIFLLAGLVVFFIPIIPVLQLGFLRDSSRFLFFISWSLAILLAWLTHLNKFHTITLVFVVAILASSQQKTSTQIENAAKIMEEQSRFLIEGSNGDRLLPLNFDELDKLDSLSKMVVIINQHDSPSIVRDEEELLKLGDEIGAKVFQFDDQCQCILQMGKVRYQNHVATFRSRLAAGANQSLSVLLEVKDQGFRKLFRWKFSGSEGRFQFYIHGHDMLALPSTGEMAFANTGILRHKLHVYIHLISPEGWIARSPLLTIHPTITHQVSWSGKSALDWSYYE